MNNDLISREALKEEVNNRFDNSAYFPFRFLELIDKAPTVDTYEADKKGDNNDNN